MRWHANTGLKHRSNQANGHQHFGEHALDLCIWRQSECAVGAPSRSYIGSLLEIPPRPMTAHVQSFVLVVTAGLVLFSCSSRPSVSSLKKEVLLMSATPQVAEKANGRDLVWWPSGSIAREALFVMGTPTGTWKFYNESGQVLWEGTYKNGKRWSGTFIGSERPGADFFLTMYPMKKITFGGGVLLHEEEFLKELRPQ